jgi:anti-sigma regulatory factor (Ser/Thr protein kinase)
MFVTCFYALLDPASGAVRYANAGHDLPYRRGADGVDELHARGMPLGLMPGMRYEEAEMRLVPGDTVLFHSDGLVEAHDRDRAMFGFPRLKALMADLSDEGFIPQLLGELAAFTGPGWEQEDDVTLLTLQRTAEAGAVDGAATATESDAAPGRAADGIHPESGARTAEATTNPVTASSPSGPSSGPVHAPVDGPVNSDPAGLPGNIFATPDESDSATSDPATSDRAPNPDDRSDAPPIPLADLPIVATLAVASEPGNERGVAERVAEIAAGLGLPEKRLEQLKTAVAEATMNAMEHGNGYDPDLPVTIRVAADETTLHVAITDLGDAPPGAEAEAPDLEAKLAGEQSPRGWGLFLIRNMVDEMRVSGGEDAGGNPTHTVELIVGFHDPENDSHPRDPAHEGGA